MEKKHILICDDEELLCVTVADILRHEGYHVSVVHDGEDVFPVLEKEKVDLILLDLMMPRMNGMEALERIRRQNPETKVIMVSAYGSKESIRQAEKSGADGFVGKPFGAKTLAQHIKQVLTNPGHKPFHEPPLE